MTTSVVVNYLGEPVTDEAAIVDPDLWCPSCSGTGVETDICGCCEVSCEDCGGTGVVPREGEL